MSRTQMFDTGHQESLGPDFDRFHQSMKMRHESPQLFGLPRQMDEPGEGREMSIAIPGSAVLPITESGEIRNGFHPESPGLRGKLQPPNSRYTALRIDAERTKLGIPEEAGWEDRPIYGFLREHKDQAPNNSVALNYGPTILDVHASASRRVTQTKGDSFTAQERASALTPSTPSNGDFYRELQFGSPTIPLSHIKRASLFDHGNDPSIQEQMQAFRNRGVPARHMIYHNFQPTLDKSTFGEGMTDWVDAAHYQPTPQMAAISR